MKIGKISNTNITFKGYYPPRITETKGLTDEEIKELEDLENKMGLRQDVFQKSKTVPEGEENKKRI